MFCHTSPYPVWAGGSILMGPSQGHSLRCSLETCVNDLVHREDDLWAEAGSFLDGKLRYGVQQ